MRLLARLFSLLLLMAAAAVVLAVIYLRPAPEPEAPLSGRITRIMVDKSDRQLVVYDGARELRRYAVALGRSPMGDKMREGDNRTPEGLFRIDRKNPASAYHLSLGLDYPLAEDRARARAGGYDPGGDIMIHGQPNGVPDSTQLKGDWTAGCIALPNAAIREIYAAADIGTQVEIRP
jgi:murein L,D-transpeptidase YafK